MDAALAEQPTTFGATTASATTSSTRSPCSAAMTRRCSAPPIRMCRRRWLPWSACSRPAPSRHGAPCADAWERFGGPAACRSRRRRLSGSAAAPARFPAPPRRQCRRHRGGGGRWSNPSTRGRRGSISARVPADPGRHAQPRPSPGRAAPRRRQRQPDGYATTSSSSTPRCGWPSWPVACDGSAAGRTSCATRCRPVSSRPAWARTGRASSAIRATRTASASSPPGCTPVAVCSRCRWCCRAGCRSPRRPRCRATPTTASPTRSTIDEVRWLVREYGESAAIAIDAGRRRHRDPRQPRRRRAVVPLAADQPPRRRVRRHRRGAAPVPARDRRGDPVARDAPDHARACGSASTR